MTSASASSGPRSAFTANLAGEPVAKALPKHRRKDRVHSRRSRGEIAPAADGAPERTGTPGMDALHADLSSANVGRVEMTVDMQDHVASGRFANGGDRLAPAVRRTFTGFLMLTFGSACVAVAAAQDRGWEEMANREAQRIQELHRAEVIEARYENMRAAAHARMRLERDGSAFRVSTPDVAAQFSCPVTTAWTSRNEIGHPGFAGADRRPWSATGSGGEWEFSDQSDWRELLPGASPPRQLAPDFWTMDADSIGLAGSFAAESGGTVVTRAIPYLPSALNAQLREGMVHVLNHSAQAGTVRITAVDDAGRRFGPVRLFIEARETVRLSSLDLENGNPAKGLPEGASAGAGAGDWRLELSSELDIEVLSYVRTWDGDVVAMHDTAPGEGTAHHVALFQSAGGWDHRSLLRLTNPGRKPAEVSIKGIDSRGNSPGSVVALTIPPGASRTYTAAELESGGWRGLRGSLGDGTGEWRLTVESESPLLVMSLLKSRSGHLANLSTAPPSETEGIHVVPLLPSGSDPLGREGIVRVINRSSTGGEVRVKAFDDSRWDYADLVLTMGAGEAVQLSSQDIERGNLAKGLTGGTGVGDGDWRLELSSGLDIEVLSYVRTPDGLLTAMHDTVPAEGTTHRVENFNPGGVRALESQLRLINPGDRPAEVKITGAGSGGQSPAAGVSVTIPAGETRTFSAADLESGSGDGVRGSMGDGAGAWRLTVESDQPLIVMNLLDSPTGHLLNLSTLPARGMERVPPAPATDTDPPDAEDTESVEYVFRTEVSPIVQAKCIVCHQSGFPADKPNSRLQFSPSTVEDHVGLNLAVFEALIAALEEDEQVEDPVAHILNKVQGVGHGGGVQAAAGTDDHASLERFLGLLGEAMAPVAITPETLFEGVAMEPARSTLRRAAIVFAGRMPTEAEYAAVAGGGEDALRATIRELMTGPGFHEFLIRAGNDRLLTDRDLGDEIASRDGYFVDLANKFHRLIADAGGPDSPGASAAWDWMGKAQYGVGRAPLELIAHVVENDLPYTDILTADYIMANPQAAEAYGAPTEFDDPGDVHEFKPSEILSYYRKDESFKEVIAYEKFTIRQVTDPGNLVTDYPHAGILNTTTFLLRFPTTPTNRNRARSRWTYYHFLGLDIEKSAGRTTDPVALADTNNPTLLNPACTVCHTVLDPVAGAFQNYDDGGLYRSAWGGLDSLDKFYKEHSGGPGISLEGRRWSERATASWELTLTTGANTLAVWPEEGFGAISLDRLDVLNPSGERVLRKEFEELPVPVENGDRRCGQTQYNDDTGEHEYLWLWGDRFVCAVWIDIDLAAGGAHTVEVVGWSHTNDDPWRVENDIDHGRVKLALDPYREGDTWYRDMREPGFGTELAPNAANSLQWLARKIVADGRFAEATVKFWWPAIMGTRVADAPEDQADADFDGRLLASNSQAAEVARLAEGFRSGFRGGSPHNLKDLLVEIVLSNWFRAESLDGDDAVRTVALRDAGARRLLTPRELADKTLALTGFQWGRSRGPHRVPWTAGQSNLLTNATQGYALLYGGIDSDGVTERATDFTAVMAGVAQSHALQSSHPIVMREFFLLPEEERRLFRGVDTTVSPVFAFGGTFRVEADSWEDRESLSATGALSMGDSTIRLRFANDFSDDDSGADRNVRLDRLVVSDAAGVTVYSYEFEDRHEDFGDQHCGDPRSSRPDGPPDHFVLWGDGCSIEMSVSIPSDGAFSVEVVAWADQAGDEPATLSVTVESDAETSAGANRIRAKLAELIEKLHGIQVAADSPEVRDAYGLFLEVWELKRGTSGDHFLWNDGNIDIEWADDQHFFDGIADHLWRTELDEHGNALGWDWDGTHEFFLGTDFSDSQGLARTWAVVLAYLMMDYRYLYL